MEVDSQYTYDDGCCIFSNFGLNLQSTTGQSVTINDWFDESMSLLPQCSLLLGYEIYSEIFLEKTLCIPELESITTTDLSQEKHDLRQPSGKGIEVSSLIKRLSQSYEGTYFNECIRQS